MRIRTALLCSLLLVVSSAAQGRPPESVSSKVVVAPKSEPGERLVLTATVYDREGKAPLPNVTLFAYHTDATGVYSKPVDDSRNPRLKAWVKTDAQGRFELDTIRPASYPGGGNPAHIHVLFMEAGGNECWFEGDRYLTENQKQREGAAGKFSRIVRLTKGADGVWRGEWNLRAR